MEGNRGTCDRHGKWVEGFIVCVHILQGAAISDYQRPSGPPPQGLGHIYCADCMARTAPNLDDLKLICHECARVILDPYFTAPGGRNGD